MCLNARRRMTHGKAYGFINSQTHLGGKYDKSIFIERQNVEVFCCHHCSGKMISRKKVKTRNKDTTYLSGGWGDGRR